MGAVEVIDTEVRDIIRREGIDPAQERHLVQKIADDVITEYGERALSRPLPPLGDPDQVARSVLDAVAGYGPLQRYFDDPDVEEIWINEPSRVFVARKGRSELTTTILTEEEVKSLVERMLKNSSRRLDTSSPFVDATLPDGSRLHVVNADITGAFLAVNIRKHLLRAAHLDDLVSLGTLTEPAARFLEASVAAGLNILVSGGVKVGKTTLLNCLIGAVPAHEHVVTCEEVFELKPMVPDITPMQTRQASLEGTGEVTLRQLVKEALRMRPDRLIVGEVREQECYDLLMTLSSGNPGMCTVHANDARGAVRRMHNLALLAQENLNSRVIAETVAASVDLVVHLGIDISGRRRVQEIVGVPGRFEDEVIELEPVFVFHDGELVRANGFPPHPQRYQQAGFDLAALLSDDGSMG